MRVEGFSGLATRGTWQVIVGNLTVVNSDSQTSNPRPSTRTLVGEVQRDGSVLYVNVLQRALRLWGRKRTKV